MGTRSVTRILNKDNATLLCLYRQMDGYPIGMGADLAEFTANGEVVNGISDYSKKVFNGFQDLAAQLLFHLKQGGTKEEKKITFKKGVARRITVHTPQPMIGDIYVIPPNPTEPSAEYVDSYGGEWYYQIEPKIDKPRKFRGMDGNWYEDGKTVIKMTVYKIDYRKDTPVLVKKKAGTPAEVLAWCKSEGEK